MKKHSILFLIILIVSLITACSNKTHDNPEEKLEKSQETKVIKDNEFTIVAKEATLEISEGVFVPVWTFNGSVPGTEIRVKEGAEVKFHLKNELPVPISIHWHGVPVPNEMDGIPGKTMDAILPGESYTYEFVASTKGTYWYHTHQDGVNQLDRGLYGAFIIEEKDATYDKDYTLILDEWTTDENIIKNQIQEMLTYAPEEEKENNSHNAHSDQNNNNNLHDSQMNHGSNDTMNHGPTNSLDNTKINHDNSMTNHSMSNGNHMGNSMIGGHNMSMYDVFTINGKSGDLAKSLKVREGEKVRLRIINAGYLSHQMHLHGHEFKVISTDGQKVNNPTPINDQLISISPGERYDIEFTANNPGQWLLESHDTNKAAINMKTLIQYEGEKNTTDKSDTDINLPLFDLSNYGKNVEAKFTFEQQYDLEYKMDLGTAMNGNNMVFTINNKTFPNAEAISVNTGDKVKVLLRNTSQMDDHPMHLHGHFFQVLSKNGKNITGSPIIKDTINLKPGDEYVVAFEADNPGNWLLHCHDLHHASAGMVTELNYKDYKTNFKANPKIKNKPE